MLINMYLPSKLINDSFRQKDNWCNLPNCSRDKGLNLLKKQNMQRKNEQVGSSVFEEFPLGHTCTHLNS